MTTNEANPSDLALRNLEGLLPDLAEFYKDVHSHPELSMQETRTAKLAADRRVEGVVCRPPRIPRWFLVRAMPVRDEIAF